MSFSPKTNIFPAFFFFHDFWVLFFPQAVPSSNSLNAPLSLVITIQHATSPCSCCPILSPFINHSHHQLPKLPSPPPSSSIIGETTIFIGTNISSQHPHHHVFFSLALAVAIVVTMLLSCRCSCYHHHHYKHLHVFISSTPVLCHCCCSCLLHLVELLLS